MKGFLRLNGAFFFWFATVQRRAWDNWFSGIHGRIRRSVFWHSMALMFAGFL
jgi:hypothetical protein